MTLSEKFASTRGAPQLVDGESVVPMVRISPAAGEVLHVALRCPTGRVGQGLRLKMPTGRFTVSGVDLRDAVLWFDTAPSPVRVEIHTGEEMRLWNCWKGPHGQAMAWVGNAGIVLSQTLDGWLLRCSDGVGSVQFDDLVVEISRGPSRPVG